MVRKTAGILRFIGRVVKIAVLTAGALLLVFVVAVTVAWDADLYLLREKIERANDALFGPYQPNRITTDSAADCRSGPVDLTDPYELPPLY